MARFYLCILVVLYFAFTGSTIEPPYYGLDRPSLEYELPPLHFEFGGLEPYIDSETVRVHYLGYHAKYTENLNNILKEWRRSVKGTYVPRISVIEVLRNASRVPGKYREGLVLNAGGYFNHALYWATMTGNPTGEIRLPEGLLAGEIKSKFHSFLDFQNTFTNIANSIVGSGYVWLCRNQSSNTNPKELVIVKTGNEVSSLSHGYIPLLVIDVWEHSYFLRHKNHKGKYVTDWWYLVDWTKVSVVDQWWKKIQFHDEL